MARARAAAACVSTGCAGMLARRRRPARHGRQQPHRHHQHAAEHHGRQRRDLRFELQLLQSLLQARLQAVGALARLARVEPGVGLAGLLLQLELLGAVIPVGDLLGQPVLDGRLGLGDQRQLAAPHLRQVLRHHVRHGIALRLLLQLAGDPGAFGPVEDRVDARLTLSQRPVVEIGRVVQMAHRAVGVEFHIEHPLGNDAAFASARQAGVLDGMFEIEEHARLQCPGRARPPAQRRA